MVLTIKLTMLYLITRDTINLVFVKASKNDKLLIGFDSNNNTSNGLRKRQFIYQISL